jgi:addiction module RelE/StbE family toxin
LKISFTPTAIADFAAIDAYLSARNPLAAATTLAPIDTSISFLRDHPAMGRDGRIEGTRELVVPDTNYIVIYTLSGAGDIFILTIVHGREQFPPECAPR